MSFDALALARPQIAGLPAFAAALSLNAPPVARFASNENALGPSPRALEAIARAAVDAHRYPDAGGAALKKSLAEHLGTGLTPAHLALGGGANELIELLVHVFVGPGDEVVVSRPTFVMYGIAVRLLGGRVIEVPSRGWEHDLDAMLAAIGPKTRLVFVCNPDNPTGTIVRREAFERFLAGVPPNVVVVSDEAYHEYVEDPGYPRTLDHLEADAPLVVLRTFSKVHSLAGLRVGYAIARPALASLIERVRQPYTVNAVAQAAALAALDDADHVARSRALVRSERPWLERALGAIGITTFPSHANFLLADLGTDSRPVCSALEAQGLLLRDLVAFGAPASCVRITFGTRPENEALVQALAAMRGRGVAVQG
ncbi:MAG: histidinol-phosphate transaminase [Candidatus Eiseniibacteriota bacterium]